jgi:CheY-like chemotaxis protein
MQGKQNVPSILLVEDNPVDLDLILLAFKKGNFVNPVQIARDGEEALSWIARWDAGEARPAVMLLDLRLPKISGLEVLRGFKEHPVYNTVPVVVLTSSAEDGDIQKAYQLGANSYIVKPVELAEFISVAQQVELYWLMLNKRTLESTEDFPDNLGREARR